MTSIQTIAQTAIVTTFVGTSILAQVFALAVVKAAGLDAQR